MRFIRMENKINNNVEKRMVISVPNRLDPLDSYDGSCSVKCVREHKLR